MATEIRYIGIQGPEGPPGEQGERGEPGQVDPDAIEAVVEDYLTENPPSGASSLSALSDVDSGLDPVAGQVLGFDGDHWTARTLPVAPNFAVPHFAVGVHFSPTVVGLPDDFITDSTFVLPPVTEIHPSIHPAVAWIEGTSNDRDGIYADVGDAGEGLRTYEFVARPASGDLVFVTVDLVDDPIFAEGTPIGWRLWQVTNIGVNLVAPIVPQIDAVATQLDTLAALVGPHGRRPSGHMAWVFGRHDGALNQDGVTDWLEPELDEDDNPVLIDAPESVYHGLPVMRPTASTIGGTSIGASPHTVVALANQATSAHNGIWDLYSDELGVEGIFCVRTPSWVDVWFADPDNGPVPGAGTPFIVSQPTPRIAVTVGDGMDVNSVMLNVDAADVTVDVDGITATNAAAAFAELAGGVKWLEKQNAHVNRIIPQTAAGIDLSDIAPETDAPLGSGSDLVPGDSGGTGVTIAIPANAWGSLNNAGARWEPPTAPNPEAKLVAVRVTGLIAKDGVEPGSNGICEIGVSTTTPYELISSSGLWLKEGYPGVNWNLRESDGSTDLLFVFNEPLNATDAADADFQIRFHNTVPGAVWPDTLEFESLDWLWQVPYVEAGNGISKIVKLTESEYNALGSPDEETLYVIVAG